MRYVATGLHAELTELLLSIPVLPVCQFAFLYDNSQEIKMGVLERAIRMLL